MHIISFFINCLNVFGIIFSGDIWLIYYSLNLLNTLSWMKTSLILNNNKLDVEKLEY